MKVLIFGNSGSGKSFLARLLSVKFNLPSYHLDNIMWDYSKTPLVLRNNDDVTKDIESILQLDSFIVEGIWGNQIKKFVEIADMLIFLNIPLKICIDGIIKRDTNFTFDIKSKTDLAEWAYEYYLRDDEFSFITHTSIFNGFNKTKLYFTNREQVNLFLL